MVERIKGLSAVVDLFVIAEAGYIGVEALLPLVQCAGGALVYYAGLDSFLESPHILGLFAPKVGLF